MNIIFLFLVAIGLFLIAGRTYPRYISRVYDVDDRRPTPAVELHDGRDYVVTKPSVVFAHHYATIAGVAPLVGPILVVFSSAPYTTSPPSLQVCGNVENPLLKSPESLSAIPASSFLSCFY